jgi:hypothetical protein
MLDRVMSYGVDKTQIASVFSSLTGAAHQQQYGVGPQALYGQQGQLPPGSHDTGRGLVSFHCDSIPSYVYVLTNLSQLTAPPPVPGTPVLGQSTPTPGQYQTQQQHQFGPPYGGQAMSPGTAARAGVPAGPPSHAHHARSQSSQPGLPRLNTGEMVIPPTYGQGALGQPLSAQMQTTVHDTQARSSSGPDIYFHHWQPPQTSSTSKSETANTTPQAKDAASHQTSQLSSADYSSSPKKRKATGPPSSQSHTHSSQHATAGPHSQPSSTAGTPRGHSRNPSEAISVYKSVSSIRKQESSSTTGSAGTNTPADASSERLPPIKARRLSPEMTSAVDSVPTTTASSQSQADDEARERAKHFIRERESQDQQERHDEKRRRESPGY